MGDSIERSDASYVAELQPASESPGSTPATLNLRTLERVQTALQYAALLVLLVFVGLIVVSYFQLRRIRQEIAHQQAIIDEQTTTRKRNERELANQAKLLEAQKGVISVLQKPTLAASEADPEKGTLTREAVEQSLPQVNN